MNKTFNVDGYLREVEENFSNFNGDDYYGVDDSFEYDVPADGGVAAAKSPVPYQVSVENTTAGTLTAILFGFNQYFLDANFGSATGIVISMSAANITYQELLTQSAFQPFETSLIRIESSNSSQVTQIITITVKDANGQSLTTPLITQNYFAAYQQQATIIDIPYSLKVDGNTSLSFSVLATTTVSITFFPAEKVNNARVLGGSGAVSMYGNPQVNLGGMTFPKRPQMANAVRNRLRR